MQLIQRDTLIFATMFVYGPTGASTWYVATLYPTATANTWAGSLIATTGPWFGTVPFNPANVTGTEVGLMTWTATSVASGTLTYAVNGTSVTKNAVRETIATDNFAGTYLGGVHAFISSCANAALDGVFDTAGQLKLAQSGSAISIQTKSITGATAGATCSYAGTLKQTGLAAEIVNGTFSCSTGDAGTFGASELQVTAYGISGRVVDYYTTPAGCTSSGWIGGARSSTTFF
jgi:hypothetical protein